MGTGIVSVALGYDGDRVPSRLLLGVAALVWVALVAVVADHALRDRARLIRDARGAAALTAVAATAVLGSKFTDLGWSAVGAAFLALAGVAWLALIGPALCRWPGQSTGGTFLLTVSTQSLGVLAAAVAARERAPWLEYLATGLVVAGVLLYALVLARFDGRQLLDGRGDQWVCGGALAITTLALAQISLTAQALGVIGGGGSTLSDLALAAWVGAVSWLPGLVLTEALRPRPSYRTERWATVFPLGMYAVCSFTLASATGLPWLREFATAWTWLAVVVWAATGAGLVRQALRGWLRMSRSSPGGSFDNSQLPSDSLRHTSPSSDSCLSASDTEGRAAPTSSAKSE